MPIWHHPDFKSGYPYQLISAKTFSIDAIARSSCVHAGLYRNSLLVRTLNSGDSKFANISNKRTNGPVNAHLRSAVYTNDIENSPSIGADEALGPFFFSE